MIKLASAGATDVGLCRSNNEDAFLVMPEIGLFAIADGIYRDRAYDRMPILADALEEAGCANPVVLLHCRDVNQVHVRGCWVVDLILGKE